MLASTPDCSAVPCAPLTGCVAELLLTVDPWKKTRGALREEVASDLGRELLSSLRHAAEVAAGLLGTTAREVLIDYSDHRVMDEVLVRGYGLPRRLARRVLPQLWKNGPMYLYMAVLSRTDYLLHFDSDVVLDHIYPKSSNSAAQWLTAAGAYLQNSTALQGLWSVGFDDCSPYPMGTVDLVLPLLPESRGRARRKEFATLPGRCGDAGGGGKLEHLHQGELDLASCEEMCRHAWMRCTGFEFHEPKDKEAVGRCIHLSAKYLGNESAGGSNVTCHVGIGRRNPRDPRHRPRSTRGPIYLRMQRYQTRGPLAMLRSLLLRTSRFKMLWPLLRVPAEVNASILPMEQFSVNIDTILEMRMLAPLRPGSLIQPIAAFLAPERVGGACVHHGVLATSA
eukprot:s311_g11.t1